MNDIMDYTGIPDAINTITLEFEYAKRLATEYRATEISGVGATPEEPSQEAQGGAAGIVEEQEMIKEEDLSPEPSAPPAQNNEGEPTNHDDEPMEGGSRKLKKIRRTKKHSRKHHKKHTVRRSKKHSKQHSKKHHRK